MEQRSDGAFHPLSRVEQVQVAISVQTPETAVPAPETDHLRQWIVDGRAMDPLPERRLFPRLKIATIIIRIIGEGADHEVEASDIMIVEHPCPTRPSLQRDTHQPAMIVTETMTNNEQAVETVHQVL